MLDISSNTGACAPAILLAPLQDDIRGLNACVAKEFYVLAGALQAIAGRAGEMAGLSRVATSLAASGESEQVIGTLQQILAGADGVQALAQTSRARLQEILECLEASRAPLSRLSQLPSLLKTVRRLARIQASRLSHSGVDVSSLAADIQNLAERIERDVATIAGELREPTELVTRGVRDLEEAKGEEQQQATDLIQHVRTVLASLRVRAETSRTAAQRMDEQYANIHGATNKIVMSLQSEDIARQRVEHVLEALGQASAALETGGPEADCATVVLLQRSQLLSTRDLLTDSIRCVFESLRSFRPRVEKLTSETAGLASETNQEGQSFAAAIEDGLGAVSTVFGRYSASARTVVSIVDRVVPAIAGVTQVAGELKKIASSLRFVALNARIETSHLADEGAAMRVMASEVQKITEQSTADTHIVLEGLSAMDQVLAGISSHGLTSVSSIIGTTDGKDAKKEISSLIDAVIRANQEMSAKLGALLDCAGVLRTELDSACQRSDQGDVIAQAFDEVLGNLDRTLARLGWTAGLVCGGENGGRAGGLNKLYSMQSERLVHEQLFNSGENSLGEDGTPGDLGDNVELF